MSWPEAVALALPDGAVVRTTSHTSFEPEPRNVARARRFVAEHAPELEADLLDTLLLLTSELVTNAVVHARTEMEVAVTVTDSDLVVTVHDLDLGRRDERVQERDGGRGLSMVRALSCACGQTRHPGGGKTCWFRLCRDAAANDGSGTGASA